MPSIILPKLRRKPRLGARVDRNHPLSDGLVSWWLMNESGGRRVQDIAGPNHGTLSTLDPDADWVATSRGVSLDFSGGTADLVDVGTFSVVTSLFTMGCWIYIDSFSAGRDDRFISKADGTGVGNHDWMLGKTDSSGAKIRARANRMSSSLLTVVGATTVTTGAWNHALMTYDGTQANPVITVFLNGFQDGQGSGHVGEAGNLPNNTDAVYIGNQPTSTTSAPDGRIDNVRIWRRLLSLDEIQWLVHEPWAGILQPKYTRYSIPAPSFDPAVFPWPDPQFLRRDPPKVAAY